MADPDIPMAYGTPVAPMMPPATAPSRQDLRTATAINGGRSSRVLLPTPSGIRPRLNDDMRRTLKAQGFTDGLAEALMTNKIAFPISIWIVDNSGSMASTDGNRIVETAKKNVVKMVSCSRWAEMQQ